MKFSILIAHYNHYEYFKKCYDSIIQQTYDNIEIILVDDCSTDDSFEKIISLTKDNTNVHIYKNDVNKGVGYTKKRCIELANGEICGFLDPDDAITEEAIETIIHSYNKDIIAVYSQMRVCDENLSPQNIFKAQKQIKNNDPLFFNIFFNIHHFFTFRKSAYNKTAGINENLSSAEDQDLYLKLYEIGNFKFIKKPLYQYRIHKKGLSQEIAKKEQLHKNWNHVLHETLRRRNLNNIYGKDVDSIDNLALFIKTKKNTFWKKLINKIS